MRRFAAWILVVALVGSGTVALAGVAAADASRPASFCSSARGLADEFEGFDPNDLTDTEVFAIAGRAYKKLAKQAPSSLESAFTRITAYYETLEGADGAPTDPEDVAEFIEQSTKVGKALNKVFRYLSSKCDIDLG